MSALLSAHFKVVKGNTYTFQIEPTKKIAKTGSIKMFVKKIIFPSFQLEIFATNILQNKYDKALFDCWEIIHITK